MYHHKHARTYNCNTLLLGMSLLRMLFLLCFGAFLQILAYYAPGILQMS